MKAALLMLSGLLAACVPYGPTAETFAPAQTPRGVQSDILLRERGAGRIRGELLEVRQSEILVLRDSTRVTLVALAAIRTATFANRDEKISSGDVSRRDREKLRLMSRFPSGLPPNVEAQLLAAYGQTELDKVTWP